MAAAKTPPSTIAQVRDGTAALIAKQVFAERGT